MMGQAGQQQDDLLGFPLALAAGHQAQGLLVLAACRFNHGAPIIGIGKGHWLVVDQGSQQHCVLIPALLLGGANHPLPRRPTKAVGA
jgi:hypothetical protein